MIKKELLQNKKVRAWSLVTVIILFGLYLYWRYEQFYPSTDDAYVQANTIQLSPQVSGPMSALYVENFQTIKKGQLLFNIDPATFTVVVDRSKAQLDLNKQNVDALMSAVKVAEALVLQRKSELNLAQQNYTRTIALVKRGHAPLSEGDRVTSVLSVSEAALAVARDELLRAKSELGDIGKQNAQIRLAEANLASANLDLGYTQVFSPADGYVVGLSARVGATVSKSVPLFTIIDSSQWWVDAHFKETQLGRIQPGQPATIVVDIYPHHTFKGVVVSLSRGSGAAFSIFPPENATGNWVKITQRFTVKVRIIDPNPKFPLRIGASSTVTIDTTKKL